MSPCSYSPGKQCIHYCAARTPQRADATLWGSKVKNIFSETDMKKLEVGQEEEVTERVCFLLKLKN